MVVTNTSAFTTAHATFDDPVPAQIVADGGWTTATTGTGTTATPASAATGFPAGVALVIAPGGTVTFTITVHVSATYNGTAGHQHRHRHAGDQHGLCGRRADLPGGSQLHQPGPAGGGEDSLPTDPNPVPGQQFTYTVTVTNPGNSATASGTFSDALPDPPLDAAGAAWTCTPSSGSTCGSSTGTGSPSGVPITVAPNGGTVTFAITVTIRPSETAVTVDNVGSVTPGSGTACVDGQPTCKGEDTFTATPETALLTITKSQAPTTPAQGGAITYTVVVSNTSAFTTAHATFDDPVPAQIVADGGWTTTTTGTGTTATPASAATGFPAGVTLTIAPLGTVTFTITAHVSATYNGTQVTNTATATPGTQHGLCGRPADLPGGGQLRQPGPAGGGEDPLAHESRPGPGSAVHLHGDGDQPGQQRHRFGHVLRSAAGSAAGRSRRHLDVHPERRVDVWVAAGEPADRYGIAHRGADHGGPQRRQGDVRDRRHHPAQ